MSRLSDVTNAAIKKLLGTKCVSKITLAINAGGAATVKNTNAIVYAIAGLFYTASALSAQSIAVTHGYNAVAGGGYVQPVSTTVYYTLALNAAGTLCVVQGSYAGQALSGQMGTSAVGDGAIPDVPDGYCPIGYIKVVTDSTHTFTAGTTVLDSAGITATYQDLFVLP